MLTPDQWRRIERLFEAVEGASPEDRSRVLASSGEGDDVRLQVLRMLDSSPSGLLDVDLRARLMAAHSPGDLLAGRFRIEHLIAEGGMGEVYRAFDIELQIHVALKTIHRILARDDFAIERFKQEVQLARSINHPNVCRIFDLQKHQGRNGDEFFLTMELLDGETLRARLDRERILPEPEATAILEPLLEAMRASHERGVLHLDLKPSNIHLARVAGQREPRVVVTDFGLATTSREGSSGEIVSAGTPSYMAPEQFDRLPASPATDVYAAGVVLYEMLCGRLPFAARTAQEMRDRKMRNQRSPAPPGISPRVEAAVDRALHPDAAARFESATAFLAAVRPRPRVRAAPAAVAAAVLLAIIACLWWFSRTSQNAPLQTRKLTGDSGYSMEPSLGADGRTVIYASDRGANGVRSLWRVRHGGSPMQLTFDAVDSSQPNLSPDGRLIAYRSERAGGGLYIMPSEGGESRLLAPGGERPRFSPDGKWVLYMAKPATSTQMPQVFAVSVLGRKSAHVSEGFRDAHNPIWSEDGTQVLFCGTRTPGVASEEHDWWLIDVPPRPGGSRKTGMALAINQAVSPAFNSVRINEDLAAWSGGYVYYVSPQVDSSSIWRVRYDGKAAGLVEPPQRLTYGASFDLQPAVGGGKMAFASSSSNIDIWTLALNANAGVPLGEPQRVTDNMDFEVSPSATPDGGLLLFTRALGPKREIRLLQRGAAESRPWSEPSETADQAVWSPDGAWAAYRVLDRPRIRIYMRNLAGESRLICPDCGGPTDWSPDRRHLLYEPGAMIAFVGRLDIATGDWTEWIKHPHYSLRSARYSPDGKWVAFHAETASTERRLFIAPNEAQISEDKWIAISPGRAAVDLMPSWSPDGNLLYFVSQRDGFRCIWAQKLDPATKRPVGAAIEVQHFHRSRRSLLRILTARAAQIGFRVYRDRAYFAMDEVTGNLWMADLPAK